MSSIREPVSSSIIDLVPPSQPLRSPSQDYLGSTTTQRRTNRARWKDIVWNAFLLTFPMLLLTCILFSFVFAYQVRLDDEPFTNLKGNESALGDDDAYYVNLNSTFLVFLASWMSSLAPMLAGFAITLAAYPIAGRLFEDSTEQKREHLLTPYQLSITLSLANGSSWSALWSLFCYRFGWGKGVKGQGRALRSLTKVTVAVVFIGVLVFGADTWLHVVTKTVSLTRLTALSPEDASYSLSLSSNCTRTNNTISELANAGLICTIDPMTARLQDGTTAMQTLNNQSNTISIFNNGPDTTIAYLALSPSQRQHSHDFTATTVGLQTACRPISRECGLATNESNGFNFNCSGWTSYTSLEINKITDDYFLTPDRSEQAIDGVNNPYYYAVASLNSVTANPTTNIADDPDIAAFKAGTLGMILMCEATFYDVEYDIVEGNVTRFQTSISNSTVANVFQPSMYHTFFGRPNMQNAMTMASVEVETAQDLADQFAIAYSKIVLSIGAASFLQTPTLAAQLRDSILVAKVPKAPLFLLVITNLIFVIMGLILAVFAARSSKEAREVQSRFNIAGLVAGMLEGGRAYQPSDQVEKLYDEYWETNDEVKRVGVERTSQGGYVFRLVPGCGKELNRWNS